MPTLRDQEEQDIGINFMQTDLNLKQKQAFWETPRNLFIIFGALAAIVAALAGVTGYRAGQQSSSQIMFPPGTVITIPPAKP